MSRLAAFLTFLLAIGALAACGSEAPIPPECAADSGCIGAKCQPGGCIAGLVCDLGVCKKVPSDGDAEADTSCSGACSGTPATKCINDDTDLCVCSSTTWAPVNCVDFCTKWEKTAVGCGFDATKNIDYCTCIDPSDGDLEAEI